MFIIKRYDRDYPISSPTAIKSPLDCKDNDSISTLLSSSVITYLLSASFINTLSFLVSKVNKLQP